jgi:hypothetical protein
MVDSSDGLRLPVLLHQQPLSRHAIHFAVYSLGRGQSLRSLVISDTACNTILYAKGPLLLLSWITGRLVVFSHRQEGQFVALCNIAIDFPARICGFTFTASAGQQLFIHTCTDPYFTDTSFAECNIALGTVTTLASWDNKKYDVLHALGDNVFIVADRVHGRVQRMVGTECVEVLMDVGVVHYPQSLGLPFVGYLDMHDYESHVVHSSDRAALCMSSLRCTWLQACAV